MGKNLAQRICTICFVVGLVITAVIWLGVVDSALEIDKSDDIFGTTGTIPLALLLLLPVFFEEFIFYISIRYFLSDREDKTRKKSLIYGAVFLVNLLLVGMELTYIFPYIR